jgi:glycine/D-amino acid oxidase-like deaminating enzyme
MASQYDAIVIGAGQAGPPLAARLAGSGMKVAVCERKLFGGTCVNTGCVPTKTLVASAYMAHMARRAAHFGVDVEGRIRVDMKQVKARKDAIVAQSRTGVESWLKSLKNCTVYEGQARFVAPHEVMVADTRHGAGSAHPSHGCRAASDHAARAQAFVSHKRQRITEYLRITILPDPVRLPSIPPSCMPASKCHHLMAAPPPLPSARRRFDRSVRLPPLDPTHTASGTAPDTGF